MPLPEILVFQTVGDLRAHELVGGSTLNALGPTVSGFTESAPTNAQIFTNRLIEYRGLLCTQTEATGLNADWVMSWDRVAGSWSIMGGTSNTHTCAGGLYVVNTGSTLRLCSLHRNPSNGLTCVYSDNGTGTSVFNSVASGHTAWVGPGIVFNNKIYLPTLDSGVKIWEVDPIALVTTLITPPFLGGTVSEASVDFCVYDDRLFCLTPGPVNFGATGADWELYEFVGGGFSLNTQITTDGRLGMFSGASQGRRGQPSLFIDPATGDMAAVTNGYEAGGASGNSGSTAYRLTPSGSSFTPSEVTSTVIPAAFRPGVRGSSNDYAEDRWLCYTDTDPDPSAAEVYLFFAAGPAPGTSYTVYQWEGFGAEMTNVAAGPSVNFYMPHQKFGGGDRINRGGGNQIVIESSQAVTGGFEISYRVYGTLLGQSITLWYSLDQEIPSSQATILSQTGGSGITGGNTVTGVDGDDGATLYTLVWNLASDGVTNGDACHIVLRPA